MDIAVGDPLGLVNQFEMYDFTQDPVFDEFIDLIRGETDDPFADFQFDLVDDRQEMVASAAPVDVFGFNGTSDAEVVPEANDYGFSVLPGLEGEMKGRGNDNEEENSSSTTPTTKTTGTTTTTKKRKVDRSRTLICERSRREKMKEKLYELRALVPNITKMDKASIIGDAVLYVQELQVRAKKLKAEISSLEASLDGPVKYQDTISKPRNIQISSQKHSTCKKIIQIDMFQVEEREFYIRLVCNRGEGVAASLYRALESLHGFRVQSSSLVTVSDKFTLTLTLNMLEFEQAGHLGNLKLWVSAAFLNQGFQLLFNEDLRDF